MSAVRERLPQRRRTVTVTIEFVTAAGVPAAYEASVGYDDQLWPREIFLSGAREGSEMAAVLSDAAVLISLLRQYGVPARIMARSMARVPALGDPDGARTTPASVIGAAVDLLLREERERELAAVASVSPGHYYEPRQACGGPDDVTASPALQAPAPP